MICRVLARSTGANDLPRYLFSPGEQGEHADRRVVGAWAGTPRTGTLLGSAACRATQTKRRYDNNVPYREHAVEVTLQPIRRFPLDAAILFADLPQVAAAMGQTLDYRAGDGPVLTPPVRSAADIADFLSVSRLHEELAPIYQTVRQLTRVLPAETALIGYAGAPWTIATYMVEGRGGTSEHSVVKQWALSDPDGFQPLIDMLTTAVIQFLGRQIEAGAEAVQLFDTWAGILPNAFFERWCTALAEQVRAWTTPAPPNRLE